MDIKKLDKSAKKIGNMYGQGLEEIVDTLFKAKDKMDSDQFLEGLKDVDVTSILKNKLKNIETEYLKAHVDALESVQPPINKDD